jgi:peptidoglycan/LPS O-acetylase OafA/YrhL
LGCSILIALFSFYLVEKPARHSINRLTLTTKRARSCLLQLIPALNSDASNWRSRPC